MRGKTVSRWWRGVAALVVALAVILPGTVRPAHADEDVPRGPNVENVINAAAIGIDMFLSRSLSVSQLQEIARQLSAAMGRAVPSAADEIKNHNDSVVVADVNGYLNAVRVEMVDFSVWFDNEISAAANARDFSRYAGAAKAHLERPTINKASRNALGFAVNVLYANAVPVRDLEILGYPGGGVQLLVDQIAANRFIKDTLAPECGYVSVPAGEGSIQKFYRCTGVDGTVKEGPLEVYILGIGWVSPEIGDAEKKALADAAGAKTSWAVAVDILPKLEAALAQRTQ